MHNAELIKSLNDLLSKEYHEVNKSDIIQLYGIAFPTKDPLNPTCGSCLREAFQKLQWSKRKNYSNIMAQNEEKKIAESKKGFAIKPVYETKLLTIPRFKLTRKLGSEIPVETLEKMFKDPEAKKYVIENK